MLQKGRDQQYRGQLGGINNRNNNKHDVSGTILSTLYLLNHLISKSPSEGGSILPLPPVLLLVVPLASLLL